ncbi:hypothetical protein PV10_07466 [Exophiala mesophila]|uniref:Uncharacterized protein n=1 Tax=Exophiala mesophila TaxID=212818 RepID=A0A0D1WMA1_EXOME|nr:uncharacterized protein PV10_07466 [Exophiala mesophila]KIV90125.1 hypothetical protein PV10_07466 [Exophiala mesophila]
MATQIKDQDVPEHLHDFSDMKHSWASGFWAGDGGTKPLASIVFIMPTIFTGQGTEALIEVATDGAEFHERVIDHLVRRMDECQHNLSQHDIDLLFRHIQKHRNRIGATSTKPHIESIPDLLKFFLDQATTADALAHKADSVSKQFSQIKKISKRILADQQEQGRELVASTEGRKKLKIATNVLDTVWDKVQVDWRTLKAEVDDFEADQSILQVIHLAEPESDEPTLATKATPGEKWSKGSIQSQGSPVAPYAEVDWKEKGQEHKDGSEEGGSTEAQCQMDKLLELMHVALGAASKYE